MLRLAQFTLRLARFTSSRSAPVLVGVALLGSASAARADDLTAEGWVPRLEAVLASPSLRGARLGVLVAEADSGAVLFAREPDRKLIPASNQKVLISLAAAAEFGPAHRFVTEVLAGATPDGDGRVPWLAIRGSGDPAMTSEQWWRLAADLRRLGVRRVAGPVWLDASAFDSQHWHPAWGKVSARAYHAPVAAISANYGAYAVVVEPTAAGEPARVRVDPPLPYLRISNQARSSARGVAPSLVVDRREGEGVEWVVVTGHLAEDAEPEVFWRSVLDPVAYAGSVLAMQLEANGIEVEGPVAAGPVPDDAVVLHAFEGKDLGELLRLGVHHIRRAIRLEKLLHFPLEGLHLRIDFEVHSAPAAISIRSV